MSRSEMMTAKAVANFESITGRRPNSREIQSIVNKIRSHLDRLMMPTAELPRVKYRKGFQEARDWQAMNLRFHRSLLRYSSEDPNRWQGTAIGGLATTEPAAYNFEDDDSLTAVWNGHEFVDPIDGAKVAFGKNDWASPVCKTVWADDPYPTEWAQ